jgi:hypothetical protein
MTEERLNFLRERMTEAAEVNPCILRLRDRLLSFGGVELVVPGAVDPDIEELVQRGSLIHGPVELYMMDESVCHENVAKLWDTNPGLLRHVGTGYALTPDGLWRQHSWGIKADGTIVETTVLRSLYFGLVLDGDRADFFVFCNSGS